MENNLWNENKIKEIEFLKNSKTEIKLKMKKKISKVNKMLRRKSSNRLDEVE